MVVGDNRAYLLALLSRDLEPPPAGPIATAWVSWRWVSGAGAGGAAAARDRGGRG